MSALVRHFGDRAGASRPCGHCDFCSPQTAVAQKYEQPTDREECDLRDMLATLKANPSTSAGRLFEASSVGDRSLFDRLLDGLARAGLVSLTSESWINPLGREVTYQRVNLTEDGRQLGREEPLGVLLPEQSEASAPKRKARAGASTVPTQAWTGSQAELETRLREWRKAEAAQSGKPAFFVFSDAILRALVAGAPRTIPQLLTIHGIGPNKAERYGAAICALCRGEAIPNL
jgi:ATP-dependent DNA helicase RecQ